MSNIRAILIDPFRCVVEHVDLAIDSFRDYYPVLSHATMKVRCLGHYTPRPPIVRPDIMFIDDEFRLKDPQRGFVMVGFNQVIAGKALIVGGDGEGNEGPLASDIEIIKRVTTFLAPDAERYVWTRVSAPWSAEQ